VSHPEQLAFFEAVARRNAATLDGARIIEIGSYDVNGSVRKILGSAGTYVGVDLTPGPGVDIVEYGHRLDHPDGSYDVSVSGECFEHDPHWRETFANMVRLTRPGGLVAVTCASHGRPEHGTWRTDVTDSPGTQAEGMNYYRNLVAADFDDLPLSEWFSQWRFWYIPTTFDLYFAGIRAGGTATAQLPTDADVEPIKSLLPRIHRMVRLPLRAVAAVVRDEKRYQRIVLPYWLFLLRRSAGSHRAARTLDRGADQATAPASGPVPHEVWRVEDTRGEAYAQRLRTKEYARWKRVLDVQAPYRWNLKRQDLGRTLDVGCGIGRNLGALSGDSVGVDHNTASVAEARRRGFTALTTDEWATSELRSPGAFDSLLFAHVIEHMDEPSAVQLLEDYLPQLKPGGHVFFICPQDRGYRSDPTHVRFVDLDALAELARKVGLVPVRGSSFPFPRFVGKAFTHNEFCLLARASAEPS